MSSEKTKTSIHSNIYRKTEVESIKKYRMIQLKNTRERMLKDISLLIENKKIVDSYKKAKIEQTMKEYHQRTVNLMRNQEFLPSYKGYDFQQISRGNLYNQSEKRKEKQIDSSSKIRKIIRFFKNLQWKWK